MDWREFTAGDWLKLGLIAVVTLVLCAGFVGLPKPPSGDSGFGREWDCAYGGHGGPVCVRRVSKPAPAN